MDEKKLKDILQNISVPESSHEARKAAVNKALAAYDKKSENSSQGSSLWGRLMDMTNFKGSNFMSRKHYATTAMALVIGVFGLTIYEAGKTGGGIPPMPEELVKKQAEYESIYSDSSVAAVAPPAPQVVTARPEANFKAEAKQALVRARQDMAVGRAAGQKPMVYMSAPDGRVAHVPLLTPSDVVTPQVENNDKFEGAKTNAIKLVAEEPVSTFSVDVDTASYSYVRSQLNYGRLPDKDSVRVEELVNYFDYDYKGPESKAEPFKANVTVLPSPWKKGNQLVHVGIKGYEIGQSKKPRSNLVFLIDTSGSMNEANKLPLLVNSFGMLVDNLDENDTVSIVTYAGSAGTALEPTKVKDKQKILSALGNLYAGGSTAGAEGIRQAYALAEQNFDKEGINRIILATDGDFNVGISDPEQLKEYISKKRESGIFLSVLGFGQGNYNDALMQKLAQNGNGNVAYIDNINEARKVLVEEASSTLFPIAKDVKIQLEFNPAKVSEYRLVGYETRMLNREDFNNDKVDAGDIGSGHKVTAIYEITPVGGKGMVDELRYGKKADVKNADSKEFGFLKIRYKLPKESKSKLISTAITKENVVDDVKSANSEVRFSVAVAAFGQLLRGDSYIADFTFGDVVELAKGAKGEDKFGYRAEFIKLAETAKIAKATNQ